MSGPCASCAADRPEVCLAPWIEAERLAQDLDDLDRNNSCTDREDSE